MNEDYQWRQLGSIVNQVLMDARTEAVRKGAQLKSPPRPLSPRTQPMPANSATGKLGHGFLNPDYQAKTPAQLELPFGIAAEETLGKRSAKTARLM